LSSGNTRGLADARRDLGKGIDLLQHAPSLSSRADKLAANLLQVLQKQYEYIQEVERSGKTRSDFIGTSPQSSRYERLEKDIDDWVQTEGARYGIENTK